MKHKSEKRIQITFFIIIHICIILLQSTYSQQNSNSEDILPVAEIENQMMSFMKPCL
jgi:hypothetical protein